MAESALCEFLTIEHKHGKCYCYNDNKDLPGCGDKILEGGICCHPERTCHLCPNWNTDMKKCIPVEA